MQIIPLRVGPRSPPLMGGSFDVVENSRSNTSIITLRRILQNKDTIADFVEATASHLRGFRSLEANKVAAILKKLTLWSRAFRDDPLCTEFLRVVRTSEPLWRSLFTVSNSPSGASSFTDSLHDSMLRLVIFLAFRQETSLESKALTELWASAGIFDALDGCIEEAFGYDTENHEDLFSASSTSFLLNLSA